MIRQHGIRAQLKSRQQGAVAIIVAICLVVLIGMLGLVLDLGHLYVTKTELQNAADAAALSGAKELDGKLTGINRAITRATEAAGKNKYNLHATTLQITSGNMRVGACPQPVCMVPISSITSDWLAADKTFLEVNTGSRRIGAWFAQVMATVHSNLATSAVAVAGKYTADITPIAICKLDDPGTTNELGYERGMSYKVSQANPIGPGTMYWIDPESNRPGVCNATSANDTRPYVCSGKIAYTPLINQTVNTNTGVTTSQLHALDSRFDVYNPQGQCSYETAPPDTNIKEYLHTTSGTVSGSPNDWMVVPNPVADAALQQQGIAFVDKATGGSCSPSAPCKPKPFSARQAIDHGVLWTRFRPEGKTVADWSTLYKGVTANNYPETSPYAQSDARYFQGPSASRPGREGRRTLNMVIVECSTAGGVCRPATVLGVGKFFMQRKAVVSGDNDIYVEFGGLIPTTSATTQIKLYR